jgi:glyoxylase-like metal-dependent hydrolase (beta-lactamase superfamily II)
MHQSSTLMIGDVRVRSLVDLDGYALVLRNVFPDVEPERYASQLGWLEPTFLKGEELYLVIQSMVIEADGRRILVDACVGEHKPRPSRPLFNERRDSGFIARLATLGLAPEDIDVVFCTHLHIDHVGWNTRLDNGRWVPTFPRARYLFGRTELAHWQAQPNLAELNGGSFVDSVEPIIEAGLVDLVVDGYELGRGLTLRALPGHTPGQLGLDVQRGGERAFFIGDTMHSPLQLVCPDLSTSFDSDKAKSRETRRTLLEAAMEDQRILVPCHFRGDLGCRLARHGDGYVIAR